MRQAVIVFALALFVFGQPSAEAADIAKIGLVDFQKILETSSAGKAAQAEINRRGKKMETDLKARGEEIEGLRKKLEREALVMSKEMRTEKEREVRIKINDMKSLQKKFMREFKGEEARLLKRMQGDVGQILREMGKKQGYLLILEKREAGVFYAPTTIDITDEVVRSYNLKYSQKMQKSGSGAKKP